MEQKQVLKYWFGSSRWVYNQCLNYINQTKGTIASKKVLRDLFLSGKDLKEFSNGTPYDIRDGGMNDLLKNIKSNVSKIKNKSVTHFKLKFKKAKDTESIYVPHKFYGTKGMYQILSDIKKSESENLVNKQVNHDFRILKDNNGEYWMCLPITKTSRSERQAKEFTTNRLDGTISLDPGVRTFLVGYDGQNNEVIHIGEDAANKIEYLCVRLDSLQSKSTKANRKKRYGLKKAMLRLRKRIRNMVSDMHFKVANFLCENYSTIILPSFGTQRMVSNNKLHSKTARNMMNLSHYLFKQRLLSLSQEYTNCKVEIVSETYTSKTCGNCGKLNENLKSSKLFKCQECDIKIDRDANGARNILLKNY